MVGITGLNLDSGNTTGLGGGPTGAVGNLKVARISLLVSSTAAGYSAPAQRRLNDRFQFIPTIRSRLTLGKSADFIIAQQSE
jgi:hypothetical protein